MAGKKKQNRQNSNTVVDFEIDTHRSPTPITNAGREEQLVKFNFADFENILRQFSGDGTISVKKWITEFEQYADTFHWNELQKFIFCKRSLKGAAKIFVECDAKSLNYYELKSALIQEFQPRITSADVHSKLKDRRKKTDES